jgi:hypothetical protein
MLYAGSGTEEHLLRGVWKGQLLETGYSLHLVK